MERNTKLQNDFNADFVKNTDNEDADEFTFNMWKSELQRELKSFWRTI